MPRAFQPTLASLGPSGIQIGAAVLTANPILGILPMQVIAEWADIDVDLTSLLCSLLKADFATASAMFQEVRGQLRMRLLDVAAKNALPTDGYRMFQSVMDFVKPSQDCRHAFAHYIWGSAISHPEALLLIYPRAKSQAATRNVELLETAHKTGDFQQPSPIDPSHIEVYSRAVLEQEVANAKLARKYISHLRFGLAAKRPQMTTKIFNVLLKEPKIKTRFDELSKPKAKK